MTEIKNLDVLSSIWILACNDYNPQITYQGIIHRLGLPQNFDVKNLVKKHGELFRRKTTTKLLTAWKDDMINGRRLPTWIEEIKEPEKRTEAINNLQITDVFRSQFRPRGDSPKSEIEIISWGLEHIERLRKSEMEYYQEKTKKITGIAIPIISALIAFASLAITAYVNINSNRSQIELKNYEIKLKPKQQGYLSFMKSVSNLMTASSKKDIDSFLQAKGELESAYYELEPFLSKYARNQTWENMQQYFAFCSILIENTDDAKISKFFDSYSLYRDNFRINLYNELFNEKF